jgi:hypothetical protein
MAANVKAILRTWEDLKAIRQPREASWQMCADYFMPNKDFSTQARPSEIIRRRIVSSLGPRILSRGSGLAVAYLIDQASPFIGPNVKHALVRAGRSSSLSSASIDYLGRLEYSIFDAQMMPKSGYISSISRAVLEAFLFGNGVQWIGRQRGFGPKYQMRPFRSCWFAENEDGDIDTLYFRYQMPAWRVCARWPDMARQNEQLWEKGGDEKRCQELVTLLAAVEPRAGGRMGAVATQKPFQYVLLAVDHQQVLEESGYDSFPYAVARLNVEEGSAYGTGQAWHALPDILAYNQFQQLMEKAAAGRADPILFTPGRLFPKGLDRRNGAVNRYDPTALGFQRLQEAIQRLEISGDPVAPANVMDALRRDAEEIFYVDWMSLNDGVQKTAEEIRDRRDLRLRAMSSLVPSIDRDLIGKGADRTLEIMAEEGLIPPPPEELGGMEVGWDYKGPLAMMQQRGQFEAVDRLYDLALKAIQLDPNAAHVLMVSEGLRVAADALGPPGGVLRSREDFDKLMDSLAEKAANDKTMEQAQQGATALRDGAQGLAALGGLSPSGGAGGRPVAQAA